MTEYKIIISSPPDREHLIAEIFFANCQFAEVSNENNMFGIEFYSRPDNAPWKLTFKTAIQALNEAKTKLMNR